MLPGLAINLQAAEQFVSFQKEAGSFWLAENGEMATVVNLSADPANILPMNS